MRRPVRGILSRTWRVASVPTVIVLVTFIALPGCEVERVKFSRLEEGTKFLAAGDPFQAAVYFQEALVKEKDQRPAAEAHLVVACDRAARRAAKIPSERQKYEQLRTEHLAEVRRDPAALSHLVAILNYHDVSSQSAEHMLVDLGQDAAPALLEAYALRRGEHQMILRVLGEIGVPAVSAVRDAINTDGLSEEEQAALVRLIGALQSPQTEPFLREVRTGAAPSGVQTEAAAALYRLGDTSERDFLVQALDSRSVLARRAAAAAMFILAEKPGQAAMIGYLSDIDADVRHGVVVALGGYPATPEAIHALIRVIREETSTDVANAAVDSLGLYGPGVIDPALDAFALETDWPPRQRLIRTLTADSVRAGFSQDQEYRLYQLYEKRARHPQVKGDMARLLEGLEPE